MGVMRAISCFWLKNVAKVPALLNLMPALAARARRRQTTETGDTSKSWRQVGSIPVGQRDQAYGQGSETNARSSNSCPHPIGGGARRMSDGTDCNGTGAGGG